jgi:hypothetical protein
MTTTVVVDIPAVIDLEAVPDALYAALPRQDEKVTPASAACSQVERLRPPTVRRPDQPDHASSCWTLSHESNALWTTKSMDRNRSSGSTYEASFVHSTARYASPVLEAQSALY